MKYVIVSYSDVPSRDTQTAKVGIYSDDQIDRKFTQFGQDFIVYRGQTLPVLFSSEYDNQVRDFATVMRVGYQGLNEYQA
jgi:hypothetical protein